MTINKIKEMINEGVWFNAEGNYYKLKRVDNEIYMRVYAMARDNENGDFICREFYRLDPDRLHVSIDGDTVTTSYDDLYVEPVNTGDAYFDFEKEADAEYENGVEAIPSKENDLVCRKSFSYSTPEEASEFFEILKKELD